MKKIDDREPAVGKPDPAADKGATGRAGGYKAAGTIDADNEDEQDAGSRPGLALVLITLR